MVAGGAQPDAGNYVGIIMLVSIMLVGIIAGLDLLESGRWRWCRKGSPQARYCPCVVPSGSAGQGWKVSA